MQGKFNLKVMFLNPANPSSLRNMPKSCHRYSEGTMQQCLMASLSKQSLSQMDRPTFMVVFGQAIDNFMQIEKMLPVNARYYDYQILQEN